MFSMFFKPETNESDTKLFNTNMILTVLDDLKGVHLDFKVKIMNKAENFQEKDSGEFIDLLIY